MKTRSSFAVWVLALALPAAAAEPWTADRLLDYALAHNPDIRMARHRIAAAQAALAQADAAFWPTLQAQSSYTRTSNPMLAFGDILNQRAYRPGLDFNAVPEQDDLNVRGLATAPLYAGGSSLARRRSARALTHAATQDAAAVRNLLGYEVIRSFQGLLKTTRFIQAATAAVEAGQTNLAIGRKRMGAGALLKSELLALEVRLAESQEELLRARHSRQLAERGLKVLVGMEQGELAVADSAPAGSIPDSRDFSQRPELIAAFARENAQAAEVRARKGGYAPRINAFGSVDNDYGFVTRRGGQSFTAGVVATWDIWDGFSTRAKVREAEAGLEAAREESRKLRLALSLEIEQAELSLQAARERVVLNQKAVQLAAEGIHLTRTRFEQGRALSGELVESERALLASRVRQAEAEADERIAIAALRKGLGLPQFDVQP